MELTRKNWKTYIDNLAKADDKAAELIMAYLETHEIESDKGFQAFTNFFYEVVTKYSMGASEMAAQAYEILAEAQGAFIPSAMPAVTPSYGEVIKAIRGTMLSSDQPKALGQAAGRLVRRTGVDTTINNALRDGAEWAWVPSGDTCAFCMMLASEGWHKASKNALKNGHAKHIHANCDCTYAVRFDGKSTVQGYDPDYYKAMYDNAEGDNWKEKLNSMRRDNYALNKDRINAQKRIAYALRTKGEISIAAGQLPDKMKRYVPDKATRERIINEGIKADKPIFVDEGDYLGVLAKTLPEEEGYYTVVLHGAPYYLSYKGQVIDPDTLCAIIAQRKDYKKGTDIRLISCYTGKEKDGVAQYIADKLNVNVLAPDKLGVVNRNVYGQYQVYSGSQVGVHDGKMVLFKHREKGSE